MSIITTWLTQRYGLQAQLAVKRADAVAAAETALRTEKEKRYLTILQNVETLFGNAQDPAGTAALLRTMREVWLPGDQELVRKIRAFLGHLAGSREVGTHERLLGGVVLDMRRSLGLPSDGLSNHDFRLHGVAERSPEAPSGTTARPL